MALIGEGYVGSFPKMYNDSTDLDFGFRAVGSRFFVSGTWIPDSNILKAGFGIRLIVLQVPIPGFLVGLCTNIFFSILVRQKH